MSDSLPPIFGKQSAEPASSAGRFARFAALFSFLAPCFAILFYLFLFLYLRSHGQAKRAPMVVAALFPLLFIFSGWVLGIVALALTRQHGRKGIFGAAMAGVCLNSLFVVSLFALPFILRHTVGNPRTPQARLDEAVKELTTASDEQGRFYALGDAAKESFVMGKTEEARKYATELLELAPKYESDWNYGNAIQDGNLVLGRIAVKEGQIEEAKKFLLAAGNSKGSPQMDSFGPNMSLAKDLLEKGEKDVVVEYFELCRKFWEMDRGRLDNWSQQVKAGGIPDFGANLVY